MTGLRNRLHSHQLVLDHKTILNLALDNRQDIVSINNTVGEKIIKQNKQEVYTTISQCDS